MAFYIRSADLMLIETKKFFFYCLNNKDKLKCKKLLQENVIRKGIKKPPSKHKRIREAFY